MKQIIAATHRKMDISNGSVFAADSFNVTSTGKQMLFMVAHRLVTDLVSWQIILHDLELLLRGGDLPKTTAFSFWKWCELQAEQCQALTPQAWGTVPSNDFRHAFEERFQLSPQKIMKLLNHCTQVLHTEPVDIFVAGAAYSSGQIFTDRALPTCYCENHGREAPNENVDLSDTVGWSNTLVPVNLGKKWSGTFVETMHRVKATRELFLGTDNLTLPFRVWALSAKTHFASIQP